MFIIFFLFLFSKINAYHSDFTFHNIYIKTAFLYSMIYFYHKTRIPHLATNYTSSIFNNLPISHTNNPKYFIFATLKKCWLPNFILQSLLFSPTPLLNVNSVLTLLNINLFFLNTSTQCPSLPSNPFVFSFIKICVVLWPGHKLGSLRLTTGNRWSFWIMDRLIRHHLCGCKKEKKHLWVRLVKTFFFNKEEVGES